MSTGPDFSAFRDPVHIWAAAKVRGLVLRLRVLISLGIKL